MRAKYLLTSCLFFCVCINLFAQFPDKKADNINPANAPEIVSRAAVLIDAETGTMLFCKNPNAQIPPASLTKLMTMHIVMNAVKEGKASYDELIPITVDSWAQSQPPRSSLMFLAPGQIVTLREILLGLAVVSGNDAAVAAALRMAPTMKDFADMMNAEARSMGLTVTRFSESSGISSSNITTAFEFARFCRHYLKTHPNSLKDFHSVLELSYPLAENVQERHRGNPKTISQDNRNLMLRYFEGVDGLKTGFINESGFNIALTAERNNTRFICVILGAPNQRGGAGIRDKDGENLLTWAFENYKTVRPVIGQIGDVKIWKGKTKTAALKIKESEMINFTSHTDRSNVLSYEVMIPQPVIAPFPAETEVGFLLISDEYGPLKRVPLVTAVDCEKANIFKRIWHSIVLLFKK